MNKILFIIMLPILFFCIVTEIKGQEIQPSEIIVKNKNISTEELLQKVFRHSLVHEDEFRKEESLPFHNIDTTVIAEKISDNRIELPCRNTSVILENLPEDEYGYYSHYTYIGRLDIINAYMVYAEFAETSGYQLIDRDSGETLFHCNLLLFSPDGKYMAVGDYEGVNVDRFELFIYTIKDKKIRETASLYYNDWVYANDGTKGAVWGSGGNIYVPFTKYPDREKIKYLKLEIDLNKLE